MPLILLLDDTGDLRDVLKEVIEAVGYSVVAGENGHAGLEILSRGDEVDIVICDIRMPDMDGFTFLKHIRANPKWADVYFVAMSGDKLDKKPALEQGADTYLPKPFNVLELNEALAPYFKRPNHKTPPTETTPDEPPAK